MGKKWTKVQQLYINNKFVPESKLTRSGDTALHIAISYYHPDRDDPKHHPHLTCIKEMIANIPKENRLLILKQKNEKGNTPLHLAAALGSVPIIESLVNSEDPTLIRQTNSKGETPLFIAAYQGKLKAFLYLHKCVQDENGEGPIELCRRGDGDNILHAAISGGYFGINIDELQLMTHKPEGKDDSKLKKLGSHLPENYQTLVEFLELLRYGTQKFRDYIIDVYTGNQENKAKDTTGVTDANHEKKAPAEGKSNGKLFPANYTIFIEFLKCLMKIVLIVLGIGLQRIKKIEERKRQHTWGVQIMELLIEKEGRYKFYESTGEEPKYRASTDSKHQAQISSTNLKPPTKPPPIVEDDDKKDEDQSKTATTDEKKKDDHKSELSKPTKETPLLEEASKMGIVEMVEKILKIFPTGIQDTDSKELSKPTKETPLLVASRMGILEMVKKILKEFPIAIQDTDSEKKNLLLLAIEHRQTEVYNWLIREKYPKHVFYQVDKEGNNALHLPQSSRSWMCGASLVPLYSCKAKGSGTSMSSKLCHDSHMFVITRKVRHQDRSS
ncbi:uncharacterized protein LOC132601951 [Lycium barbarum]|uniref:uncharacterized protein LOC132601951 n=1 Tax=Lycium barbarum TaxID=112863 RepID=UPI00293E25C8|nr:uncharacterized protein LOC132601951 [Lycium barbarum]